MSTTQTHDRTKKLVTLAMLSAIAYLVMCLFTIIAISGFLYGPLSGVLVSVVVSAVEMFTTSDTGWIGFVMNVLSSCAFVCPAACLYSRGRSIRRAAIGLGVGVVLMTVVMVLWNYIITPLYFKMPREAVVDMMPMIIAFNLVKGFCNAALISPDPAAL